MKKILIYMFLMAPSGASVDALTFGGVEEGVLTYIVQVRRHTTKELLYTKGIDVDENQSKIFILKPHLVVGADLDIYISSYGGRVIDCYMIKNMTSNFINHIDDSDKIVTADIEKESCSIKISSNYKSKLPQRRSQIGG